MKLGAGLSAAVADGSDGAIARMFDSAFAAMQKELYDKLRADLFAEVRQEVQRVAGTHFAEKIAAAIEKIGTPVVTVQASPAPHVTVEAPNIEVSSPDVTVNVPEAPEPPDRGIREIRVLRDPTTREITGARSV